MLTTNILNGGADFIWQSECYARLYRRATRKSYVRIAEQFPLMESQRKETEEFFRANYGKAIPLNWHRFYAAHSGVFSPWYFPDVLYFPYFEHFMNQRQAYAEVFEDKNIIPYIAKRVGVDMPHTVLSRVSGLFYNDEGSPIGKSEAMAIVTDHPMLFCKPSIIACGGKGTFILKSETIHTKADLDKVLEKLGSDFVMQQVVICDESIRSIYPGSVNTFRIVTYRWHDDFHIMPVAMRIGRAGSIVDNASAGGLFVGVDDCGVIRTEASSVSNQKFAKHPDTHVPFVGHRINAFDKVLSAAVTLHRSLPQLGVIGWDFTVNQQGNPLLIEANIRNVMFTLGQMTHGTPAFGERTADVLQWIRKVKHAPFSKRRDYSFGNY